jgi:hypothetical protein
MAMWWRIANNNPNVKFYAYTKVYNVFPAELRILDQKVNVNIIDSLVDGHRNYGTVEYCYQLMEIYGSFIYPVSIGASLKCMDTCKLCLTRKNVCFKIHGNKKNKDNYKAQLKGNN